MLPTTRPRKDPDEHIAEKRLTTIWIDSLLDNARKLLITDSEGFELYESNYEFPGEVSLSSMLRDGIDYIIDMEEEVAF